jgi:hypothetical protein
MKVGDKIWHFNPDRRRYTEPKPGNRWGDIIWKEHWEELYIIGETKRSWLVAHSPGSSWQAWKLPKSSFKDGACPMGYALSEEHVGQQAWVHDSAYKLGDAVQRCRDYHKLVAIKQILERSDALQGRPPVPTGAL